MPSGPQQLLPPESWGKGFPRTGEVILTTLTGALLAAVGIILLRLQSRWGLMVSGLVVVTSIADVAGGAYIRAGEPPRTDATGVWWMIFVFFAPLIVVSLPLIVWQLFARRGEPLSTLPRLG